MRNNTQVLIVRHGETKLLQKDRIHGQLDSPLSPKGISDAHKTAARLSSEHFDVLYCSPLGRARQTAAIIGEPLGLEPIPVHGLQERSYGWLEGKKLSWFEPDESGPRILLPIVRLSLKLSGEDPQEMVLRTIDAFETIISNHLHQRILIVAHWGTLSILKLYLDGSDTSMWRSVGPWTACSITEYHKNGSDWHPVHIDAADHLS